MRALRIVTAVALTIALGGATGVAVADEDTVPSRRDVHEARVAVREKADDVASVRAQLVLANQRLQSSAITAAQAAEEYNGARWRVHEARLAARAAERRSEIAQGDVDRQRDLYSDALVTSYQLAPGLTALSAITQADGIESVIDRATTMHNAEDALDGQYDSFRASATLADVATQQAEAARATALEAQEQARAARDEARAASASAAAEARSIAAQKSDLIEQLASLEHISVDLAERRQSALEAQAAAAAAAAVQHEQELQAQQAQEQKQREAQQAQQEAQQQAQQQANHQNDDNQPAPQSNPAPQPQPQPAPQPAPPAPASGAQGAIDFARAQLGEPYRWGAAGPDAWDCSGLTMGAWRAGGRYLPHYSVAQYDQATPVSAGELQPGDLVFWGSSSDPSSIYHVALYIGGGQIIHAPRTGRPVTQDSMYYWTPPNFYARP
ncbi:MAG TPA: C40 family peptidase [Nocardioides sp.]|nr:C40 family peptidase [Nocardioides sp.]